MMEYLRLGNGATKQSKRGSRQRQRAGHATGTPALFLRPVQRDPGRGGIRRDGRDALPALLRGRRPPVGSAGAVLPHAVRRPVRGPGLGARDRVALRRFLRLVEGERVPDHSTLSVTRSRLPLEVHHAVFGFILEIADKHDLVPARRIGVDASTQEANASLRRLVRRDTGEDYQGMLRRLARASGIETPTTADLIRFDRARKDKTLSNADWVSSTDPEARIAKMKDGTTHLAYKPEHAVDLDTAVIVAAKIHLADHGDTQTLPGTLAHAEAMLDLLGAAPTPEAPAELIADT